MALVAGANTFEAAHGPLHVQVWPGRGAPLVAIHGVDGNHRSWASVAASLSGERPLVAVDLRGRGDSASTGPFGVVAHADDVAEVVDAALAVFPADDGAVLLAHSFGAHVAARVAVVHPSLIDSLLLVDGGPPRVIPDGMTAEDVVATALSNIVPNLESKPYVVDPSAVEADFSSMVMNPVGSMALHDVTVPVHLLRAESGVAPGLPPIIPDAAVADLLRAGVDLTYDVVAGTTHFTILESADVVDAIRNL